MRRTPHLLPRSASLPTTPPHHGQGGTGDEEDGKLLATALYSKPLLYTIMCTSLACSFVVFFAFIFYLLIE